MYFVTTEQKFRPDEAAAESNIGDGEFETRTPSRTTTPLPLNTPSSHNSFSGLADAASPSPEPASMVQNPSPSTADIVARVINRANGRNISPAWTRPPHNGDSNVSPKARHGFRMRTGSTIPPSPKKVISAQAPASDRSSSRTAPSSQTVQSSQTAPSTQSALMAQSTPPLPAPNPQPAFNTHVSPVIAGTINPAYLRPQSQPKSSTSGQNSDFPNPRPSSTPLQWTEPLSPYSPDFQRPTDVTTNATADVTESPAPPSFRRFMANRTGLQKSRPFRTGFLHLAHVSQDEPAFAIYHPEWLIDPPASPKQDSPTDHLSQVPHATAPRFVHEVDQLPSSLEPSILSSMPDIGQTFESQWQLQTQAPYSFDSQLSTDTQSQNALL